MASVTSLDKDLRNMRLSRYTPQAAGEVRDWIEDVLQERLQGGDLLDALKDGVALCRLVNLAVSPGVKFKKSSMPFVQMENISHFLRACQIPPLSLPPHDVFLTVDLYEGKDPAQVLQCLSSFSRRANALEPSKFPRSIGVQNKAGSVSPNVTGSSQGGYTPTKLRGASANSNGSGFSSPAKSPSTLSSWSKKSDEHSTMPAWNIHQYGYMGGASQANQGVAFGARRQITTAAPHVPSLQDKEKRRREEEERLRLERQEEERMRQREREAEEDRAKAEEERRWEEETSRLREKERREVEEERKRWDEEQRQWEQEDSRRVQEEREVEEKMEKERQRRRGTSDTHLNGQFLSQYQASQTGGAGSESRDSQRIFELEQQLEQAKQREQHRSRARPVPAKPSYNLSSLEQERRMLRTEWNDHQNEEPIDEYDDAPPMPPRPLPDPTASATETPPPMPPRPLPEPTEQRATPSEVAPPKPPRPLPDPAAYAQHRENRENRVNRFLAAQKPPVAPKPVAHRPQDYSTNAEVDAENSRREAAQQQTRAGGWASKSLLEREMERERERQQEWEEGQKQTQAAAEKGKKDGTLGTGPGQGAWDVHQYGFLGGDNQNRGGHGLGVGGARRQIIGPRPPP
ncbi:hypothetical protein AWENTII_004836 [Aspergillus wentii]